MNKNIEIESLNLYDGGITVWIGTDEETLEWLGNLGNCDDLDEELKKCFSTTVINFINGQAVPGYNNLDNPDSFSDRLEFLSGLDGFNENKKPIMEYINASNPDR